MRSYDGDTFIRPALFKNHLKQKTGILRQVIHPLDKGQPRTRLFAGFPVHFSSWHVLEKFFRLGTLNNIDQQ